ncbi:MAG: integrase, partial [Alphaproteobacteria bacterium]|nr:integrase [Alphaproteobacteria bacterium]
RSKALKRLILTPDIGSRPVADISPQELLAALRKVEASGRLETARRLRAFSGQVFRYAVATTRASTNPAAALAGALISPKVKHRAAILDPKRVGEMLWAIDGYDGHASTRAALALAPHVFVRPGELRHAEWVEIDFDNAQWRIAASKMKMKMDHIVPLSKQSLKILRDIQAMTGHGRYVFPGLRTGERPMSENTINSALRGMGYAKEVHSAHGFRATARTIMDEVLNERVDLIEHQLAHLVKDANGRAYNRTSHLPARAKMMQRWADYLDRLRLQNNVKALKAA